MATTSTAAVEIKAAPADVMNAIAAIEDMPKWSSSHKSAVVDSRYDDGRPKLVTMEVSQVGVTDTLQVEYTWQGDTEVSWKLVSSGQLNQQEGAYVLTPSGAGTKAEFTLTVDLKIPMPGFLVKKAIKSGVDTATKGLKKWIEK